jgi:hypothetical protein
VSEPVVVCRPRRKSFVDARIQGRIIGRIAAYWALYHLVLWLAMFVYRFAQHRAAVAAGAELLPFRELYSRFLSDNYPLLFCAGLILPLFLIDFVRLTHRIAGPLARFRIALVQLMQGHQVENVELRKGDLLPEFQETFNEFLAFYHRQLNGQPSPPRMTAEQAVLLTSVMCGAEGDAPPAVGHASSVQEQATA